MDLNLAIQKHAEWKYRFRTAMATHELMDVASISKDNCCEMGKWLHGEAKTLHGRLKNYATCVSAHAAFHGEAGKIATLINARKKNEAERLLGTGTPYHEASKRVGVAIIELKHEIGA
ncbi:MAG: CZB domain-containing protein [Terracidiphilus sp.]